jgi:hypothetical protein
MHLIEFNPEKTRLYLAKALCAQNRNRHFERSNPGGKSLKSSGSLRRPRRLAMTMGPAKRTMR